MNPKKCRSNVMIRPHFLLTVTVNYSTPWIELVALKIFTQTQESTPVYLEHSRISYD